MKRKEEGDDEWWIKYGQIAFVCLMIGIGYNKCTGGGTYNDSEPDKYIDLRP